MSMRATIAGRLAVLVRLIASTWGATLTGHEMIENITML